MNILIPTRNRAENQLTANTLRGAGIEPILVINHDDRAKYNFQTLKVHASNIVEKRQAIIDRFGSEGKLVMCDDDMRFYTRRIDLFTQKGFTADRFEKAFEYDIQRLFQKISDLLNFEVHVGVASRFMANQQKPPTRIGGKYIRVLAYNFNNMKSMRKLLGYTHIPKPPRYRFPGHEDHDFNMQLQAMGYRCVVITSYAQDDLGQFKPGGCATWRTLESDIVEMQRFAAAWPGMVSFGKPNEKNPIGRMRIAWKKLREKSQSSFLS